MPFLIDGHNLLFRSGWRAEGEQKARTALIALLGRNASRKERRYAVVFDGRQEYPTRSKVGGVEVIYSSAGQDADSIIEEMVQQQPHYYVLVTSDHALVERLRKDVQRIETPREFLHRLVLEEMKPVERDKPEVADCFEVRYWCKLFGVDEIG